MSLWTVIVVTHTCQFKPMVLQYAAILTPIPLNPPYPRRRGKGDLHLQSRKMHGRSSIEALADSLPSLSTGRVG